MSKTKVIEHVDLIHSHLKNITQKLIAEHVEKFVADLIKASEEKADGICLKINIPIQASETQYYMEPTIEWERKNKQKFDTPPVKISLLQGEFNLDEPGQK